MTQYSCSCAPLSGLDEAPTLDDLTEVEKRDGTLYLTSSYAPRVWDVLKSRRYIVIHPYSPDTPHWFERGLVLTEEQVSRGIDPAYLEYFQPGTAADYIRKAQNKGAEVGVYVGLASPGFLGTCGYHHSPEEEAEIYIAPSKESKASLRRELNPMFKNHCGTLAMLPPESSSSSKLLVNAGGLAVAGGLIFWYLKSR